MRARFRNLKPLQRQLLACFDSLDEPGRETLLAFAQFLAERAATSGETKIPVVHEPEPIERPPQESVVKAIKRLSTTYYMLEREVLLDRTSALMMSHVMQGRDAVSVIDELEALFQEHYRRYRHDLLDGEQS